MRILFCTQMWPGPDDPDLGAFLVPVVRELEALGHEVDVVAIDHRRPSRTKYARLAAQTVRRARRTRPDVIFAHVLFPAGGAGAIASLAARTPLVVMAHGQDVANLSEVRGVTPLTRRIVDRAAAVIANSRWLANRLTDASRRRRRRSKSPTAASTSTPSPPATPARRAASSVGTARGPPSSASGR